MILAQLVKWATDKQKFNNIDSYAEFCREYLSFASNGLQGIFVSRNENNYRFFQYKNDGHFNVTRPLNNNLMISIEQFDKELQVFSYALAHVREIVDSKRERECINRFIYTCQQSIGAALDALPAGQSNKARKINGDLFERFIRIIISGIGISVRGGTISLPIVANGKELDTMFYQHDLIVEREGKLTSIGSVKTSSKDRLDKIFLDKLLHNRLTGVDTPYFAVFLNDVQRKGKMPNFGINSTFLTGHFKGYTIKLNPLDGVYYCDMRPNMRTDYTLKKHIKTLDHLLISDIWAF
jgi:hypothetical protein